ncbi:MAG: methyltransferase domain-containing protein, partial [Candidatus Marinimicrobia bacterium]|nr:methyltransferase domain-containing protein [Candidatus Neomarinimicrobiota bacterium]
GMKDIATLAAAGLAEALDLSSAGRLLDVGGGPGTFAIEFCRLNPDLRVVVFDLPEVIEEITTAEIKEAGLEEKIFCQPGDYMQDELGSGFDLVLVSNIIHSLGEAGNRRLVENCHAATTAGGRIAVKDFLLDENRVKPEFSSMFAVNMLTGTAEGNCYAVAEVKGWLADAGYEKTEYVELSPRDRLLIARKPA